MLTVEQVNKILNFMGRADIKGNDAGEFMACVQVLHRVAEAAQAEANANAAQAEANANAAPSVPSVPPAA